MENQTIKERLKHLLLLKAKDALSDKQQDELRQLAIDNPSLSNYIEKFDKGFIHTEIEKITKLEAGKEQAWIKLRPLLGLRKNSKVFRKFAIAASLIAVISILYFSLQLPKPKTTVAEKKIINPIVGNAVLTLSNGEKIVLEKNTSDSNFLNESGNSIVNINAELIYSQAISQNLTPTYNTVSTPKNVVFKLTLSDGTKVWLNSSSSIRFPTSFPKNERKVEITGEAYFEISKDTKRPFYASSNNVIIQVLGTSFNFLSKDGPGGEITLKDGCVAVVTKSEKLILKTGEQAKTNSIGNITLNKKVEIDQILAWQQGYFIFNNTPLREVIKQLQSAYNFQVEYEGQIPDIPFCARFPRNLPFTRILQILGKTEAIQFVIQGNKVIVKNISSW